MKTLIAIAAATLLSTAAMAGDDSMHPSAATFESLDKNADQQISRTEAAADKTVADKFSSLDTNGDGYVSKSEYMAKLKSRS